MELLRAAGYDTVHIGKAHQQNFCGEKPIWRGAHIPDTLRKPPSQLAQAYRWPPGGNHDVETPSRWNVATYGPATDHCGFETAEIQELHCQTCSRLLADPGEGTVLVALLGPMPALAPRRTHFLRGQRERCNVRQQRTGLPAHLLTQLESFLRGPVPEGPDVILTGEYTPLNLLHQGSGRSAMFDFGDGLVGPREYDGLGPLCFLAAGDAARIDALLDGCHDRPFDRGRREALLRLMLLHRYSNLKAQIAVPGWQTAPDLATLTALIWP